MIDENSFKIHFFTPDDKFVARRSLFYIADVENNRLEGLKQLIIDQPFISTGILNKEPPPPHPLQKM